VLAHWDDVEKRAASVGHLGATWTRLGEAVGSAAVGLRRIEIEPGRWATPAHVHGAEEEIFYVLGGSGLSWQDGEVYEIGANDCLVHLAEAETHTLRAGPDGLDVLAFGTRVSLGIGYLPRAGVTWLWPTWADAGAGDPPWKREAAVGEPEVGEPAERPPRIVNLDDERVPRQHWDRDSVGVTRHAVSRAAGAQRTGLKVLDVLPGRLSAPPHCHSAEEELFVVLAGEGVLELIPSPDEAADGVEREEHPVRTGSVVSRPAGTGVAHTFRGGADGMRVLAYGTREPNDIAYYPRSNKVYFRGVGLMTRLERLEYEDGEPDDW
jgi:uncharacterized cupin superfamily protein